MFRRLTQCTLRFACFALFSAAALAAHSTAHAQGPRPGGLDMTVDAPTREAVLDALIARLNEGYVFPETAKKMEERLRERIKNNEYDAVTSARELARTLTEHVQAVSKDKHLRVEYVAESLPPEPTGDREAAPGPLERERMRARGARTNFGFEKAERLEGNVGLLDLRQFFPPEVAGETAAAAMNLLANADALIIDLRKNGGGTPAMVALLSSYLFDGEPVHLNDLYFRPDDSTHQWWTLPYVPGKRFGNRPVYILTSKNTFSAAEEFTYNLKNLKRATIVGETTGGGAHPGGGRRLSAHFIVFVPSGRAINPISKTNWEGTGVTPDIAVPADQALKAAHLAALEKILDKAAAPTSPPEERMREQMKALVERLRGELDGIKKDEKPAAEKG